MNLYNPDIALEAAPTFDMLYEAAHGIYDAKALILRALPYTKGTHTLDDVCLALMGGNLKLWRRPDAMVITEFVTYPRRKVLHHFLVAGDLGQVIDMQPEIIEFARRNGCDALTGVGRPGWARVTERHGWQMQDRYCTLDLTVDGDIP